MAISSANTPVTAKGQGHEEVFSKWPKPVNQNAGTVVGESLISPTLPKLKKAGWEAPPVNDVPSFRGKGKNPRPDVEEVTPSANVSRKANKAPTPKERSINTSPQPYVHQTSLSLEGTVSQRATAPSARQLALETPVLESSVKMKKSLLPGEGKVGTFRELREGNIRGDNLASHHLPNDQYMKTKGISRDEGIAMRVEEPRPGVGGRHREIHKELVSQDTNLQPRDALAESVKRARKVYQKDGLGAEIRPSLQEVIQESKKKLPDLFEKNGTQ